MIVNTPFAVQVYQATYPNYADYCNTLTSALVEFEQQTPSVHRSNQGGYQSPATLASVPATQSLFEFIAATAEKALRENYGIPFENIQIDSAWLNVNRGQGSHNQTHIHDGILSGVFYVQTPS